MMRRRSSLVFALALGAAGSSGVALTASPAAAQIAAALGKPLPSPDLPVGTVSIRVVAGSAASPVVGTAVTLVVGGTPREARTDSAGRATFPGLPPGTPVVAKVLDEDKAEHASEEFTIPDNGGMRVMITTKPWQGGAAGGAPFAGGGGGMPNPRSMSGEPRAEQQDPAGVITVRLTYDDFKDTPAGVPVVLVGYAADDTTSYQIVASDKDGRARFEGLDRSGGTSYFAMAQLPRNNAIDRLTSGPVVLESQLGVRMILSSEKRGSTAPPIDDLGKADAQVETPAGKVRVLLEGIADLSSKVTLIDAESHKVIGQAKPAPSPPDPSRVQAEPRFASDPALPAGTLDVAIAGGPGQTEEPLAGLELRAIAASTNDATSAKVAQTGADGTVRLQVPTSEPQKLVLAINGRQLVSPDLDLTKTGGKLTIRAHWEDNGRPQALVDAPPGSGQVVYAECVFHGKTYRSMPFQLLEGRGSKITAFVYPRAMFRFQLDAEVEDELFAVRGRFQVTNYSWIPYRSGPDGLVLPMPKGFKGAIVGDSDQSEVSVAPGEGYRIIRPLPPGGRTFHAALSLPVESGSLSWALDLPMGTYESELVIRQTPGMVVHPQGKIQGETRTVPQGTFYILAPITILEPKSIAMTIDGLPSQPSWRKWVQGIVGLLVVGLIGAGVAYALFGRRRAGDGPDPAAEARRQRLLDELVELERSGANPKRREQLLGELERLWG
jgi:hypothetical protein